MKLYKKDSKGKIRSLEIFSDGDEVIQISGLVDGKKTERRSKCQAKNVGRANETSPDEQAQLEAESKITKKLKEGYFHTAQEAQDEVVILPMLAKSWKDHQHKIDRMEDIVFMQPKYDGMRCLAVIDKNGVRLISRSGNEIENMDHIKNELARKFNDKSNIILDGELYVHGENFQTNMKYIKKYRKGLSERIKYYLYDMVIDTSFINRFKSLLLLVSTFDLGHKDSHIRLTRSTKLPIGFTDEDDIKLLHQENLSLGYEGSIIRWGNDPYQFDKRSDTILKYKDFIDETFRVIDVVPSEKNPDQGIVECITNNTNQKEVFFRCGMKFSVEEKQEILTNKSNYIGQTAEIRFFEYSEDGIPRFPVCYGFRLDK